MVRSAFECGHTGGNNVMMYDGNVIGVDLIFPFSLLFSKFFALNLYVTW